MEFETEVDSYGVRRRDTAKGPPLRILSLDGGGVRGYSIFIILQELMHRTFVEIEGRAPRRHEIPKPCDHFDLIVGTGTGGLIALMLGRLRLDLETCKEVYVRMTRMVFETDKTIAGIPYRHTLFKASRLEGAIRQCVREHTVDEAEGRDSFADDDPPLSPVSPGTPRHHHSSSADSPLRLATNASTVSFSARSTAAQMGRAPSFSGSRGGDPNARLYDSRSGRTKTAVTAIYKGSPKGTPATMLRSYDSRKEPPPEFDCRIWEAGRATCAIGLAFKPITIGQSVFHDDAHGTFNPAPEALDEAVLYEWPGRDIGVFVSVGTGKRPKGTDANQATWYEGFLGEFAEARRRLIAKIEGCERIHEALVRDQLPKRGVNVENYYRLNVEMGVGEFGMNEWSRLGEISTGTRRYMSRPDEKKMSEGISVKLAKIHKAKIRWERAARGVPSLVKTAASAASLEIPFEVELEGDTPLMTPTGRGDNESSASYESGPDSLHVVSPGRPTPPPFPPAGQTPRRSPPPPPKRSSESTRTDEGDTLTVTAPTPSQYRYATGADKISIMSPDEHPRPSSGASSNYSTAAAAPPPARMEPPTPPPKTPLPGHHAQQPQLQPPPRRSQPPPYPVEDEARPQINMARKPDYRGR